MEIKMRKFYLQYLLGAGSSPKSIKGQLPVYTYDWGCSLRFLSHYIGEIEVIIH